MQTARNLHPIVATALLLLCLACAGGCGSGRRSVTIPAWQKNVEQYVKREGNGDPTILRDVRLPDSRRGYSMLGSDRPAESTDANGVLLGFRDISGRNWFIYLVGLVKQQRVEEIRLAALTFDADKLTWKLGRADPQALEKYRTFKQKQWRERFPQRGLPPPEYLGFPTADDHFQLTVSDGQVTVVNPSSGAQWELNLASAPKGKQHASK